MTKASTEDKPRIDDFVHDHFLPDMPLIVAFGLEDLPPPPRSPSSAKPPEHAQDFTLLALDSQGSIVGLAINRVNPTFQMDQETPPEVKKVNVSFVYLFSENYLCFFFCFYHFLFCVVFVIFYCFYFLLSMFSLPFFSTFFLCFCFRLFLMM